MANLQNLAVLVIEANQGMRAQLRSILDGYDITDVQFANSASVAIRRLHERRFDLILCEYDLGDDCQDGQHLLEDLRSRRIIPLETLFIMISGERNYERVVGTAELAPSDYILKPLTPGTLLMRIERVVAKREIFLPAYRLIDSGEYQEALDYCIRTERAHPAHRLDLMRTRAEIHVEQRQIALADALYLEIIDIRPVPWARLGHARMLLEQSRYDEAESVLTELVAENEFYLDAYDLLALARERAGHPGEASEVLSEAMERSPYRIGRLRHYAELANKAGEHGKAEQALQEVVRKGKFSEFRDPEDHVRLLKTQLARGRLPQARETLADLEKSMGALPETRACSALGQALIHRHAEDGEAARGAAMAAASSALEAPGLSIELKHEIVDACLGNQLDVEAAALASDILRNAADEVSVERTREVLRNLGRSDLSEQIETHLHTEVRNYIAVGAQKAQAGDYDGAVTEMMGAVRKMPGNPHVLFNAALALLRHIEHNGWNERLAAQARSLIARTRRLDPANPKLDAISGFMQGLVKKYGIRPQALSQTKDKTGARVFS